MGRYKQVRAYIMLVALFLSLAFILPHGPGERASAQTLTGWYEQDTGTQRTLYGVSAVNADTAWVVGTGGTILKTVDGGATWTPQVSGTDYALFEVDAVDAGTAWAVGGKGVVLRTTDGGSTWERRSPDNQLIRYTVSAVDAQTAWIGGEMGSAYLTTDGGLSWSSNRITLGTIKGISAINADTAWVAAGNVFCTVDGGATWKQHILQPGFGAEKIATPKADTAWVIGREGQIAKTMDGGTTWNHQRSRTVDRLRGISAVDVDTAWVVGGSLAYEVSSRIILKTTDGGATWECQADDQEQCVCAVSAVNAGTAWAVGGRGTILRTEKGGMEYKRYFAEGYTGDGFQEFLCLGNPRGDEAEVIVTYMFNDGTSMDRGLRLPPRSRATIDVNREVGEDREVSVRVLSDREITSERPIYFIYRGSWAGGHISSGAAESRRYWVFAESYTGPGFEEWICVLNTGGEEAELEFSIKTGDEGRKWSNGHTVPPHSRATFCMNDILGQGYQESLSLRASQPVVVERVMYFDYLGTGNHHWQGGHCVVGSSGEHSKRSYFPEGTTRPGFEEWLIIHNVFDFPITLQARYQLGPGQGEPVIRDYLIEGNSRLTLYLPQEVGAGKDVSIELTSNYPFLAERSIYFRYNYGGLSVQGGDCVKGALSPAPEWFLAEGYTGPGFDQWLCLQNPGEEEAVVELTYCTLEEGTLGPKVITIPSNTRSMVMVNEHAGPGYQFSCHVRVISGPDIAVERPMYFDREGWNGGHCGVGFPGSGPE